MKKQFINTKEAAELLNFKVRKVQRIFRNIRFILDKKKHQLITMEELGDYLGFPKDWPSAST